MQLRQSGRSLEVVNETEQVIFGFGRFYQTSEDVRNESEGKKRTTMADCDESVWRFNFLEKFRRAKHGSSLQDQCAVGDHRSTCWSWGVSFGLFLAHFLRCANKEPNNKTRPRAKIQWRKSTSQLHPKNGFVCKRHSRLSLTRTRFCPWAPATCPTPVSTFSSLRRWPTSERVSSAWVQVHPCQNCSPKQC